MNPILADAIDFPVVLGLGLVVIIPLLLFQMFVEAFVLSRLWNQPFRELRSLTLRANVGSLLAGIPTKIANGFLYAALLPKDIPQFFGRYPFAVAVGTLIYFVVTILVEVAYATRWARRESVDLPRGRIWKGMLWANIATYVVMAPLHYYATRPFTDVREYTSNVRWAKHPNTQIVFLDLETEHLKAKFFADETADIVIPIAMKAYIVSSNLNLCLYRATNGSLCMWRKDPPMSNIVWQTTERYFMDQVAFSPSGNLVAFLPEDGTRIEVVDVKSQKRLTQQFVSPITQFPHLAWSTAENRFIVAGNNHKQQWTVTVSSNRLELTAMKTNSVELLSCYSRVGRGSMDDCGTLHAWAIPGLGSSTRIYRKVGGGPSDHVLTVAANPGLLHLGSIWFSDVAFLDDCTECLIGAADYVYLLDVERKRLGTIAKGKEFLTLTPRFLKTLEERK